jgi:hypothetical protein
VIPKAIAPKELAPKAHWLSTLGSVLALLAPKGLCPICVAASGGVLSSLGLGFLANDSVIRWVLPSALLVGVIGLGLAARSHRRWWIFALGVVGAAVLYTGWFFTVKPALYAGMGLLVLASIFNLLRRQRRAEPPLVQLRIRKEVTHG